MKPVTEWNEEFIRQLPRGEFDWIEFKGRRGLDFSLPGIDENKVIENMSIQVSAMANSGGGTLIYGMTDPTDLSERKIDDGGVALNLKGRNTKEWLEDVIPHLVEMPLRRFSVFALTINSGAPSVKDGRCIILIDIPDSSEAPHQARDSRYYIRVGGKSRPAGHRIVSDIFNRRSYADFETEFSIYSRTWIPRDLLASQRKPERSVRLRFVARNIGTVYAQFVRAFVDIPERLAHPFSMIREKAVVIDGIKYFEIARNNQRRDVVGNTMGYEKYGGSWFDPILPGLSHAWDIDLHPKCNPDHIEDEILHWAIHADSSPARYGKVAFSELRFEIQDKHEIQ